MDYPNYYATRAYSGAIKEKGRCLMALKILVVDDEQENLDMIINLFQDDFPDISGVTTGQQAIDFIKEHNRPLYSWI